MGEREEGRDLDGDEFEGIDDHVPLFDGQYGRRSDAEFTDCLRGLRAEETR